MYVDDIWWKRFFLGIPKEKSYMLKYGGAHEPLHVTS